MTRPSERFALRLFSRDDSEDFNEDEDGVDGPPGFDFGKITEESVKLNMEANLGSHTRMTSATARSALRSFLQKKTAVNSDDDDTNEDNLDRTLENEEPQNKDTDIKTLSSCPTQKQTQESENDKDVKNLS